MRRNERKPRPLFTWHFLKKIELFTGVSETQEMMLALYKKESIKVSIFMFSTMILISFILSAYLIQSFISFNNAHKIIHVMTNSI